MTVPTFPPAAAGREALATFLRGVERRAALFAELLCGDPERGDEALATAMRAFRNAVARAPVADPSLRFWSLLVAVPQLRAPAPSPRWDPPFSWLQRLATGLRAALLLRLVAGLDDDTAAAVLGLAPARYRLALRHVALRHPQAHPDRDAWPTLSAAAQQRLRQLPPGRLVRLAQCRERAIEAVAAARPAPRRLRRLLAVALGACVLAFAGTFLFVPTPLPFASGLEIRASALPAAAPPAATYDADTALLTHRDFEQVATTAEDALVRDLDLYAWYAAQLAAAPGADGGPQLLPDASAPAQPGLPAMEEEFLAPH